MCIMLPEGQGQMKFSTVGDDGAQGKQGEKWR